MRTRILAGMFAALSALRRGLYRLGLLRIHGISLPVIVVGNIAVGGSGLKITAGLSGGAVNILMAVVLLAVLGWGGRKAEAAR